MRALVSLLILVAGCSYRGPADSQMCLTGFSPDQEADIVSAIDEWNAKAGTDLGVVAEGTPGCTPVIYEGIRDGGTMGRTRLGLDEKIHLWAYPADKVPEMRMDMLHELGHYLSGDGSHSADPNDVMYWIPSAQHLTARDVERAH